MKIGVLTFHWANNYGAVLQAYALTTYLRQSGHEAELIDYVPRRTVRVTRLFNIYKMRFNELRKTQIFKRFQRQLPLSAKTYHTHKELYRAGAHYDAVIAGSDQIWNKSFLMRAEKRPTPSYYLDFVPPNVRRLSYAASFGTNELTEGMRRYGVAELRHFDAVSVRESNAVEMLAQEGIAAVLVCDPTLLWSAKEYEPIMEKEEACDRVNVFNFMLRTERKSSVRTQEYVLNHCFEGASHLGAKPITVGKWLRQIQNCDFVVTDSFHCTVFAILFHKPFLAINDRNCSMNSRISTLTRRLGLQHRVIDEYNPERIREIVQAQDIDWAYVDEQRKLWAEDSAAFLRENL